MRYEPTVTDEGLKNGLTISAGLHLLMLLFLYFGLPHLIPPLPSHHDPVPFDIVTIAEITNTRIADDKEEPKPAPPPPAPEPRPQQAAPTPPKTEEAVPDALKPRPIEKPKPPAEKPAPQQDLLGSVLKNVAKLKPAEQAKNVDPDADAKSQAQSSSLAPALSSRLTITEEDALRRQIEKCWNPPVGARNAESLVVEVLIDVNPDRTVANADVVDKMRYASDPFFRAAADAAVRAVRNPKCSPLELAPDKYEQWKQIDFTFDPRDML